MLFVYERSTKRPPSGTLAEATFPTFVLGGSCTPRVSRVGPGVVHAAAPGRRTALRLAPLRSRSNETGNYLYRLVRVAGIFLRCRGERASQSALDSGRRLVEAALLRETRGLSDTCVHVVVYGSASLYVRKFGSCPSAPPSRQD